MHLLLLPLFTLGILATATVKAQVESSFCPADLSLAHRIQHFNTNIQRGIANLLDAQEKRCITASNADASEAGVTEAMTSLDDWVALYYRSFGIWHLPSQADFWDLGAYTTSLYGQLQKKGVEPLVVLQHNYTQLGRTVVDAIRVNFAVRMMAQCPAQWEAQGIVISFFLSHFPGLDHAKDTRVKDKFLDTLKIWKKKHCGSSSALKLHCMLVHDGLDDGVLEAYGDSFFFVDLEELDNTRAKELEGQTLYELRWAWAWTILRDLDKYPAVGGRSFEYVLFTDFTDVSIERDPFRWMAMTQHDFDIYMNEEVEGNLLWLLSLHQICYGHAPRVKWSSGTYYNAGIVGGKRQVLKDYVDAIVLDLAQSGSRENPDLQRFGCDMLALNRVAWTAALMDKPRWRIFSGPPFAGPFRWTEKPDRNVWTRAGLKGYYALHK